MNFPSSRVDAWWRKGRGGDAGQPDLTRWLSDHHPAWDDPDGFVPRRLVGEYLEECFDRILASALGRSAVLHRRSRVDRILPHAGRGGWELGAGSDRFGPYDEVLVTTGHDSGRTDGFAEGWRAVAPTEPAPSTALGARRLLSWVRTATGPNRGSARIVAIRGFALTAVDAILLLTSPDAAGGGLPRVRIVPFARTGRPLQPKPDPVRFRHRVPDAVWRRGQQGIATTRTSDGIRELVTGTAAEALEAALSQRDRRDCRGRIARVLEDHLSDRRLCGEECLRTMRRSVRVAVGREAPDGYWALGETWRRIYPALVERVSYGGLPAGERVKFRSLCRVMERLAFGPPPESLERLSELASEGVLDLDYLAGAELRRAGGRVRLRRGNRDVVPDLIVDAVTAAPGVDETSPLLGPLLSRGILHVAAGTAGIRVDPSGRALSADGGVVPGLAVIGRATEGWILGLDTLSRSLHSAPDRWAASVAARVSHRAGSVA
jgi:diaminopimelate decarboxylase